jgi:hypothetical protein
MWSIYWHNFKNLNIFLFLLMFWHSSLYLDWCLLSHLIIWNLLLISGFIYLAISFHLFFLYLSFLFSFYLVVDTKKNLRRNKTSI